MRTDFIFNLQTNNKQKLKIIRFSFREGLVEKMRDGVFVFVGEEEWWTDYNILFGSL